MGRLDFLKGRSLIFPCQFPFTVIPVWSIPSFRGIGNVVFMKYAPLKNPQWINSSTTSSYLMLLPENIHPMIPL